MTTTLTRPILPHRPCQAPGVALNPTGSDIKAFLEADDDGGTWL
ncbi:MAG TPA: hypothetical protein VHE83_16675 [Mycobacteriales bacterium]|nr:hypothetical protein [Mycobacteriales bacterium]